MALHIGREIEKEYQKSGLKLSEFANRLGTGTRNIYSIFRRQDINSAMLKKISEVLDFDFFTLYQEGMEVSQVEEPSGPGFKYSPQIVQLIVQLDGRDETLEQWYRTMKKLNAAI